MKSEDVATEAIKALNSAKVSYMISGSLASNFHAIPRSTQDVDFVVVATESFPRNVMDALGPDYTLDPQMSFESVTMTTRYVIAHRTVRFKIELFVLSDDEHDRQRFDRRLTVTIHGQKTWVATAEDMVVGKLRWYSRANRTKDIDDARNIIAVQADKLDWKYIERWCKEHGTLELLQQVRAEAAAP